MGNTPKEEVNPSNFGIWRQIPIAKRMINGSHGLRNIIAGFRFHFKILGYKGPAVRTTLVYYCAQNSITCGGEGFESSGIPEDL
ncbi:hypothetical protein CEXT_324311 [Caerostris extrusa]|uniref:Uncharacterized protein n=1 Tax=Caerostris extrusa TaxID=172846 RepID=A0AAV4XJW2_CAEEX|nr:hypothetical protein CEXT_324311 [Caerostris extrusa]